MKRILYVQASPRRERSHSLHVADRFLETYFEYHPEAEVDDFSVFDSPIPRYDEAAAEAKMALIHGEDIPEAGQRIWDEIEAAVDRFKAADLYLWAVPMWNFSIPWVLKQYIDCIVQPGQTFSVDPEKGYQGLLKDKQAVLVLSSGGDYRGDGEAVDYHSRYLTHILGFMGIEEIHTIRVAPMLAAGPDAAADAESAALAEAEDLARRL